MRPNTGDTHDEFVSAESTRTSPPPVQDMNDMDVRRRQQQQQSPSQYALRSIPCNDIISAHEQPAPDAPDTKCDENKEEAPASEGAILLDDAAHASTRQPICAQAKDGTETAAAPACTRTATSASPLVSAPTPSCSSILVAEEQEDTTVTHTHATATTGAAESISSLTDPLTQASVEKEIVFVEEASASRAVNAPALPVMSSCHAPGTSYQLAPPAVVAVVAETDAAAEERLDDVLATAAAMPSPSPPFSRPPPRRLDSLRAHSGDVRRRMRRVRSGVRRPPRRCRCVAVVPPPRRRRWARWRLAQPF